MKPSPADGFERPGLAPSGAEQSPSGAEQSLAADGEEKGRTGIGEKGRQRDLPVFPSPLRRSLHACAIFWLRLMFFFSEKSPRFVRMFQGFFCWFAFTFSTHVRNATLANAARILGPESCYAERKRLAKGVIRSFYLFALDVGRSANMTPEQLLAEIGTVHGYETYTAAAAAGRGLIVVTAHMGSFEVGLAGLAAQGKKLNVIFRRDTQGAFERQRSGLRDRLGVIEHPVDDGLPMWMRLRDALTAGEIVIFQGDRVMPGQRGRRVPFLHGHLDLPPGPVKLSRLTGAPILPIISTRREDGKVDLHIEQPIWPENETCSAAASNGHGNCDGNANGNANANANGNGNGSPVDPLLTKLAAVLEKYVRTYPEQWLMFHPAFSEDREVTNLKSQI